MASRRYFPSNGAGFSALDSASLNRTSFLISHASVPPNVVATPAPMIQNPYVSLIQLVVHQHSCCTGRTISGCDEGSLRGQRNFFKISEKNEN
jgi:hypothetical protein